MEWITDRLPTEADADADEDVTVQSRPGGSTAYFHWSMVRPGMAWTHTELWEGPSEPAQLTPRRFASTTRLDWTAEESDGCTPRRFASISRTVWMDHGGGQCHTLDALADDGTAWWMVPGETEWRELPALPDREAS